MRVSFTSRTGCIREGFGGSLFIGGFIFCAVVLLLTAMADTAGTTGALMTMAVLLAVVGLYVLALRRSPHGARPVEAILADVDRLDDEEADEAAFQPLFDELVLYLSLGEEDPFLEQEIVRRMNYSEGASRRMFLQLAAVHPNLTADLEALAHAAHALAPEARDLLERRSGRKRDPGGEKFPSPDGGR